MNHLLSVERLLNLRTAFRFVIKKPVLTQSHRATKIINIMAINSL